jgi:hypothetical protein
MATAWAAASVTTYPAVVRVVSGGCLAGVDTTRIAPVWLLAKGGDEGLSLTVPWSPIWHRLFARVPAVAR